MKTIGIKLADGTFYPVLKEGAANQVVLDLTTAHNNQTKIMVDLYRSKDNSMENAEYVDSLQIDNLVEHPNGEPDISFTVSIDDNNELSAKIVDKETGAQSNSTITLVSRTVEERLVTDEYNIAEQETEEQNDDPDFTEASAVAAMATGVGLLAAAEAIRNNDEEITEESFEDDIIEETVETPIEETAVEAPEAPEVSETQETPTVASQFVEDDLTAFGGEATQQEQVNTLENFFDTVSDSEPAAEEQVQDDFSSTDLPDFSMDEPVAEETPTFDETPAIEDTPAFDDSPAFDESPDFSLDDSSANLPDMDFDLPDPSSTESDSDSLDYSDLESDIPASSGLSFTGLYDKETELGDSSTETKKKTKTPVIICIICAIICIIATALILFVLPTKYNLLNKKNQKTKDVQIEQPAPVVEEPIVEPEPEPAVPEAKEDEIVIIEKAEEVVPLPPPVAEEKPEDIIYKIKWGDTLWDIADTYYKNPWRYKYIARFNGIKDPDYIISGTYITIPAE